MICQPVVLSLLLHGCHGEYQSTIHQSFLVFLIGLMHISLDIHLSISLLTYI